MAISVLQKEAFEKSQSFVEQVNSIVVQEALYKVSSWSNLDDNTRNQLAQVVRAPEAYSFPTTVISDSAWSMTYDAWASDPPSKDGEITGYVQKFWLLLTNISEPQAPSEP